MKNIQHLKIPLLNALLITVLACLFSCIQVYTALALTYQEKRPADLSPYLTAYPSQLNKNNCQTSNNQTWSCVVTLSGGNLTNVTVLWNVSTPNPAISFNYKKGFLVPLVSSVRITISNIPCTNASFLFSGQVYGGGGVFPTTVTWNCILQPTPTPRPTSRPTVQPSPTTKIGISTPTPKATIFPQPTITVTSQPTSVVSLGSQSNPPTNGNGDLSGNMYMIAALIFTMCVALVELVIIILMSKRTSFKRL